MQPKGTLVPTVLGGQGTAKHELLKKGDTVVAVTEPLKPRLQEHVLGTLTPELLAGHGTARRVLLKNGAMLYATTAPL